MFTVDHNNTGFEPVKPGEYEVIPVEYDVETAKSGNLRVVINYSIRADVDQPCQGQEIKFDNFTYTENSMWRFNQASKAAGMPHGIEYPSLEDWAEAFMSKPLRVVVGEKTYNGATYPEIKVFKESKYPLTADPFDDGKPIDISDDDLPF